MILHLGIWWSRVEGRSKGTGNWADLWWLVCSLLDSLISCWRARFQVDREDRRQDRTFPGLLCQAYLVGSVTWIGKPAYSEYTNSAQCLARPGGWKVINAASERRESWNQNPEHKVSIQHQIGVIAMRARFTHFEVRGPLVLSASKSSFFSVENARPVIRFIVIACEGPSVTSERWLTVYFSYKAGSIW